jgi:predicted RNA-binding Zn-ribbon protein involved in translation (DUF1610 family)
MTSENHQTQSATSSNKSSVAGRPSWVDVAVIIGRDPNALLLCPECGEANLLVQDVECAYGMERYVECPKCKAYNVMRKSST